MITDTHTDLFICPICGRPANYSDTLQWGVRTGADPVYPEIISRGDGAPVTSETICPSCYSFDRHRLYHLYFELETDLFRKSAEGKTILHFAPETGLHRMFSKQELGHDYYPVDLNPDYPGIRTVADITSIPFQNNFFDAVIANHVIEHIPDERLALSEIFRVLKPGGTAYINAPVEPIPKTIEDAAINTPELRAKIYGQHDHVRKYGLDYVKHLEAVFPVVKRVEYISRFPQRDVRVFGIKSGGDIYCCQKEARESPSAAKNENSYDMMELMYRIIEL